ncbi:MAG TPA: hypothetical protein VJ810_15435, partial [Blastocatellia bacterium]|nr:hypothetical protein [Blastocatellia bacterium]
MLRTKAQIPVILPSIKLRSWSYIGITMTPKNFSGRMDWRQGDRLVLSSQALIAVFICVYGLMER